MSLQPNDGVVLKRDVYVTIIPQGEPMPLPAGTLVRVIQNLGGSYTIDVNGNWFLVHEDDHDCLGVARDPDLDTYLKADGSLADRVWLALRQCYDPEIPVNIVELGLVYHVDCYQQDQEQHVLECGRIVCVVYKEREASSLESGCRSCGCGHACQT